MYSTYIHVLTYFLPKNAADSFREKFKLANIFSLKFTRRVLKTAKPCMKINFGAALVRNRLFVSFFVSLKGNNMNNQTKGEQEVFTGQKSGSREDSSLFSKTLPEKPEQQPKAYDDPTNPLDRLGHLLKPYQREMTEELLYLVPVPPKNTSDLLVLRDKMSPPLIRMVEALSAIEGAHQRNTPTIKRPLYANILYASDKATKARESFSKATSRLRTQAASRRKDSIYALVEGSDNLYYHKKALPSPVVSDGATLERMAQYLWGSRHATFMGAIYRLQEQRKIPVDLYYDLLFQSVDQEGFPVDRLTKYLPLFSGVVQDYFFEALEYSLEVNATVREGMVLAGRGHPDPEYVYTLEDFTAEAYSRMLRIKPELIYHLDSEVIKKTRVPRKLFAVTERHDRFTPKPGKFKDYYTEREILKRYESFETATMGRLINFLHSREIFKKERVSQVGLEDHFLLNRGNPHYMREILYDVFEGERKKNKTTKGFKDRVLKAMSSAVSNDLEGYEAYNIPPFLAFLRHCFQPWEYPSFFKEYIPSYFLVNGIRINHKMLKYISDETFGITKMAASVLYDKGVPDLFLLSRLGVWVTLTSQKNVQEEVMALIMDDPSRLAMLSGIEQVDGHFFDLLCAIHPSVSLSEFNKRSGYSRNNFFLKFLRGVWDRKAVANHYSRRPLEILKQDAQPYIDAGYIPPDFLDKDWFSIEEETDIVRFSSDTARLGAIEMLLFRWFGKEMPIRSLDNVLYRYYCYTDYRADALSTGQYVGR